jgi:glutamate N-acetyltransferase / amino-acid N-acetyltransferase
MAETFRRIEGSVTAPRGFRAGATACGIKSDPTINDLALLISDAPCVAAGTFTTSRTPAAPVLVCKEHLGITNGHAQAIVVNSGNANCSTGARGMQDARQMAALVGERFDIDPALVMVSSTGIIGRPLPMEKVMTGIVEVQPVADGGEAFSHAILTTDTRAKRIALECDVDGRTVRMAGTTKGAGMILPNMATMLCYITTDAAVDQRWLGEILRGAVNDSFNMICVDGDMSTNDTVLVLANGLAATTVLDGSTPGAATFAAALNEVTRYLAREIARDGEGMTKLMEVRVHNAATDADARAAARAVTLSPLWQCALAGQDPNWGRILAALGASGADFQHGRIAISLGGVMLVQNGEATDYVREDAVAEMTGDEVIITVDLGAGVVDATAWGCDLTHGYIDENTLYTR